MRSLFTPPCGRRLFLPLMRCSRFWHYFSSAGRKTPRSYGCRGFNHLTCTYFSMKPLCDSRTSIPHWTKRNTNFTDSCSPTSEKESLQCADILSRSQRVKRCFSWRCETEVSLAWPSGSREIRNRGLYGSFPCRTFTTVAEERGDRLAHTPVMLNETLQLLDPQNNQTVLDLTFGGGGHCREILQRAPHARILALDRDPAAFHMAQELAATLRPGQLTPMLGRFSELTSCLHSVGVEDGTVDSVLLDVGASSLQFDQPQRGFSLSRDGPLDMRMDGDRVPGQVTAADVVNHLEVEDLALIFRRYGEERLSRQIAQAILEARYAFGPISRTRQLADIVSSVFEGVYRQDKLQRQSHVATKTFQALRIFVNDELNELNNGLLLAHKALRPGGKCMALTFHSLEDRIVKRHFHGIDMDARASMSLRDQHRNSRHLHDQLAMEEVMAKSWEPVSKKAIMPSYEEVSQNPRARSAKLRAAVKV